MRKPASPRHGRTGGRARGALTAILALLTSVPNARPAAADALNAAGLVPLPCEETGPLRPADPMYCRRGRHFVTPAARKALMRAAARVAVAHPGAVVRYMEASWPSGERPMPPHLSHGDGRQVDLAIFYEDSRGRALDRPPSTPRLARGYGAYEPPRREAERACAGAQTPHDRPDPHPGRAWRMGAERTGRLVATLLAEPQVRRIFLEPHLKARLGFSGDGRVRFAGCNAARHDDHLHVDFR